MVAESMPGEMEMVEEFASALTPAVLGDLFRALVERMRLAGELGSLLKLEVALGDEIKKARQAFEGLKRKTLSFEFAKNDGAGQAALDFSDLADADVLRPSGGADSRCAESVCRQRERDSGDSTTAFRG